MFSCPFPFFMWLYKMHVIYRRWSPFLYILSSCRIHYARRSNSVSLDDVGNSSDETSSSLDSDKIAENLFWLIGGRKNEKGTKYKHAYEVIWLLKLRTEQNTTQSVNLNWSRVGFLLLHSHSLENFPQQHTFVGLKKTVYKMEITTQMELLWREEKFRY
jgi:hypothetical protein